MTTNAEHTGTSDGLRAALNERGIVHVANPLTERSYRELAASVGTIIGEERIALSPNAHAYVARPGRVPLHTDHPAVDVVSWWCERQDADGGASLLLDALPEIHALNAEDQELLHRVHLECPPLQGGPPCLRWPVLRETGSGTAIFCSPWLRVSGGDERQRQALERFRERLSAAIRSKAISIRLRPGESLFIDNRRVLHGRAPIAESSTRCLQRLWTVIR